jgi:hypothetical protein
MTYYYTYEGRTYEVTITEVTEDEAKPKKPRIPLIIVQPNLTEESNETGN